MLITTVLFFYVADCFTHCYTHTHTHARAHTHIVSQVVARTATRSMSRAAQIVTSPVRATRAYVPIGTYVFLVVRACLYVCADFVGGNH